jgi:hypothetical protein
MHSSTPGGTSRLASSKRARRVFDRTFFDHSDSTSKFRFSGANTIASKIARAKAQGSSPASRTDYIQAPPTTMQRPPFSQQQIVALSIEGCVKTAITSRALGLGLSSMTLPAANCETETAFGD